MTTKKFLMFPLLMVLAALAFSPLGVLAQGTPTPFPTETAQATVTPYMPIINPCMPTSIIPTVEAFTTPTPCNGQCPEAGEGGAPGAGGGTSTPTASVSATPSPVPVDYLACSTGVNDNSTCLYDAQSYLKFSLTNGTTLSYGHTYWEVLQDVPDGTVMYIRTTLNFHIAGDNNWPGESYYVESGTGQNGMGTGTIWWSERAPDWSYLSIRNFEIALTGQTNTWYHLASQGVNSYPIHTFTLSGFVEVWFGSYPDLSTPTPVATPCGEGLYSQDGEVLPSDPIAYFNPPVYEDRGCAVIFHPATLDLPSMEWSPIGLPDYVALSGWQICVQTISSSLVFMKMDWLALLAGSVAFMAIGGIYVVLKWQ